MWRRKYNGHQQLSANQLAVAASVCNVWRNHVACGIRKLNEKRKASAWLA
jgi:hypothetical protein